MIHEILTFYYSHQIQKSLFNINHQNKTLKDRVIDDLIIKPKDKI